MPATPKKMLRILAAVTAEKMPEFAESKATHSKHVAMVRDVLSDPNIVGVGISRRERDGKKNRELCICFYVAKKHAPGDISPQFFVPPVLASDKGEAVYTDVKEIGEFRPGSFFQNSPIESGFSVGHVNGLTGTVGAIVQKDGARFILSNSHVLARSGLAALGDDILYPGTADYGDAISNTVATLSSFTDFILGGSFVNDMDAALAQVLDSRLPDLAYNLPGAALPLTVGGVSMDMTVTLNGSSSGSTTGTVVNSNFFLKVNYVPGVGVVGFRNQVLCSPYTGEGDSGSLVLDAQTGNIVGLHFALAPGGGSVFSPIGPIMAALNFTFI
jgi:hypothetical protein